MGSLVAPMKWDKMAREARAKKDLAESRCNCGPSKEADDACYPLRTLAVVGFGALMFGDD